MGSDSGTISEEAALLGFPAVTVRDAHERPEGVDAGTLVVSSIHAERVLDAIRVARSSPRRSEWTCPVPDYIAPHLSDTIVRIVSGYIDIINETVWRRPPV